MRFTRSVHRNEVRTPDHDGLGAGLFRGAGPQLRTRHAVQQGKARRHRPAIASQRTVVPARLPEVERADLSRRLYEVHRRIFSGPSADEFRRLVVEPAAEATVFRLYFSGEGQIVGYCAIHRYRRRVKGRSVIVLRADAGLLPDYRGRGATYGFGILRALAEKLRHPLTPIYYCDNLLHASSYHLFCKYFPQVFPHPLRETPAGLGEIARELIDSFRAPAVGGADPFLRDVGWATIESAQETELNRQDDRPDVRFFKSRNPEYSRGHGLAVIVPITFGNLLAALASRVRERAFVALGLRHTEL